MQVSEQPLSFGALTVNGHKQVRYNVRKLSELPYHLIESGMNAELRRHVLFNYDWLHSKLAATSLPDVLADFHMATTFFGDATKVYCVFIHTRTLQDDHSRNLIDTVIVRKSANDIMLMIFMRYDI